MRIVRTSRATVLLLAFVATVTALALAAPASALDCGGIYVETTYEERSRVIVVNDQTVLLVHATRTYTVEGDPRPYYRFVSSFVDRNYVDQNGDTNDFRAGLDEGFIGHSWFNYGTGEEARNGQDTLSPDEQACMVLP